MEGAETASHAAAVEVAKRRESGSGGNVNTAVETQQVDRGQAPEDPPTQPCSIRSLNDGKDASPTDGEHYIGHPNAMSNQGGTTPTTPTFTSAPTDFIHGVSPHDTTYEDGGNDSAEGDSDNDSSIATSPKTRRNLEGDFANSDEAPSTGEDVNDRLHIRPCRMKRRKKMIRIVAQVR
ncbi:hypothetical protein GN244_ATG11841 [Phytophthora infestans]|uniref:Uncharacterized protein n=1 Tax=Phytophthora infestans TaxID=4787 RepID=A0A833WI81_PHYIN|nr:hypothetical protein GN244_ATG11841 [Phytophthora infestans]